MHTLLNRFGRSVAAAFMVFALAAVVHGAFCVAALSSLPAAPAAVSHAWERPI